MSALLFLIGGVIMLIGGVMVLIEAFKESPLWGIGSILVPLVSLIFVITHWEQARRGFLLQLCGVPIYVVGMMMAGA